MRRSKEVRAAERAQKACLRAYDRSLGEMVGDCVASSGVNKRAHPTLQIGAYLR